MNEKLDEYYYLQYAMIEERGKENPNIVQSYHELKQEIKSALKLQESLKTEFIDCDEYPPLTKWYKENIEESEK